MEPMPVVLEWNAVLVRIALGLVLGLLIVWPLRLVEQRVRSARTARVTVEYEPGSTAHDRLTTRLRAAGLACRTRVFAKRPRVRCVRRNCSCRGANRPTPM
nr:hypothetical protein [Burkholderia sp. Bp9142]